MNSLSDLLSDNKIQRLKDSYNGYPSIDCSCSASMLRNLLLGMSIHLTGEPCSITQFHQNLFTALFDGRSELRTIYMTTEQIKETVLGDSHELKYILLSRLTGKLFRRWNLNNDDVVLLYLSLLLCAIPDEDMTELMPDSWLFGELSKVINNQMVNRAMCYDALSTITEYIGDISYFEGYFVDMSSYLYAYIAAMLNTVKMKRRKYLSDQADTIQLTKILI